VSNSSRTKLFENVSEKARLRQVQTFFLSSQTVRGVCLPTIPLHNKQYNVYFKKNKIFFSLIWSDLLISQANFANFFPNYSLTSSQTVRFGSVRKCLSSKSVRFEDFQKCTPLINANKIIEIQKPLTIQFCCRFRETTFKVVIEIDRNAFKLPHSKKQLKNPFKKTTSCSIKKSHARAPHPLHPWCTRDDPSL
jgi:hypothetical protein